MKIQNIIPLLVISQIRALLKTPIYQHNFRANRDQKINKWAKMTAGFNYIHSDANEKPDGNSFFSPMNSVTIIGNFHDIFTRDAIGQFNSCWRKRQG